MTALDKLVKLEHDAADFGFKWETAQQILLQIESEVKEVNEHLQDNDKVKLQEEVGDLLHAVFSLCVFCKLDPVETLAKSVDKFEDRFLKLKCLTKNAGLQDLNGQTFKTLMEFWDKAKDQSN